MFVRQHPSSEKLQASKHDILLKSNTHGISLCDQPVWPLRMETAVGAADAKCSPGDLLWPCNILQYQSALWNIFFCRFPGQKSAKLDVICEPGTWFQVFRNDTAKKVTHPFFWVPLNQLAPCWPESSGLACWFWAWMAETNQHKVLFTNLASED